MKQPLITVAEAASRLNRSPQTIRKWIRSGVIGGIQPVATGPIMILESEIDRLFAATPAEEQATATAGALAAIFAGQLLRVHDYPEPTEAESREMTRRMREAITALLAGVDPSGAFTASDAERLEAALQGIAQGAVLAVMGAPPSKTTDSN